jgi:hypothetical protein
MIRADYDHMHSYAGPSGFREIRGGALSAPRCSPSTAHSTHVPRPWIRHRSERVALVVDRSAGELYGSLEAVLSGSHPACRRGYLSHCRDRRNHHHDLHWALAAPRVINGAVKRDGKPDRVETIWAASLGED